MSGEHELEREEGVVGCGAFGGVIAMPLAAVLEKALLVCGAGVASSDAVMELPHDDLPGRGSTD